jgi:hypothetical protein
LKAVFSLRASSSVEATYYCAAVAKGAAMAGRGPQSFKKRQKEQQRKEKQQEKAAKRLQRKIDKENGVVVADNDDDLDLDHIGASEGEGVEALEQVDRI